MAGKQLQTGIVINGKASPSLNKAFQAAQKNADKTSKSMQGIGSTVAKVGGVIATAFAINKIVDFTKDCVSGYNDIIASETKLSTIMKQRMNASDSQIQSIVALADAQEKLGVVDAESQKFGAQQLATFLNTSDSLKVLLPAMNNLAVQQNGVNVTGENMVNIGNLMGKVMQGQTGALTKVGITFSKAQEEVIKYGTEQQKAAVLAQVITDNVGQMNKAIAETPEGRMKQIENTFGQVKDAVGKAFVEIGATLAPTLTKIIPILTKLAEYVSPIISKLGDTLVPIIENLMNKFLIPNLPKIMQFMEMILSVGGQLFNDVISPILPVLMEIFSAVMPLISALLPALMPVINALMQLLMPVLQAIAPLIQFLTPIIMFLANILINQVVGTINLITPVIQNIMNILNNLIQFIQNVFAGNWGAAWENVKNIFSNVFSGLVSIVKLPLNLIINKVNSTLQAFNKVKVPEWIPLVGGKSINIPLIPQFGTGGTLTSPQVAIVGDKPETIVPHGNTSRNRALLQEAAAGVGIKSGGDIYYINFSSVVQGGADVKEQVLDAEEEFERRMDAYFARKRRLSYSV